MVAYGVETVEVDNGVFLTPTAFGYTIEYNIGNFSIINDETRWDKEEDNGIFCDSLYSYILFDEDDDIYDYWDEDGLPEIPYYSLILQTFNFGDYAIAPSNVQITDATYRTIKLDHLYLPYRDIMENEDEDDCINWNMDTDFYLNGYYNDRFLSPYTLGDTYVYSGYGASVFHINPIMYYPFDSTLYIMESATFEITFPQYDYIDLMCDTIIENSTRHYDAITFFDYYQNVEYIEQPQSDTQFTQYIVLTTRNLSNCIDEFITAKSDYLHLKMDVYIADEDFINTPEDIHQFLYDKYIESEKNLKYVLIIGGYDQIPYSAGTQNDVNDPPTDWWYGCLKSPFMDNSSPSPTIYIGRWPVNSIDGLTNIMYKTISTEQNIGIGSVSLFSGTGNGEKKFYKINRWVSRYVFSRLDLPVNNYDGRKFTPIANAQAVMIDQLHNDCDWMIIYRGHGGANIIGDPYDITSSYLNIHLVDNICYTCPIGFGFACSLNDFTFHNCIGNQLLSGNQGGGMVSFYGATTSSDRNQNNKLEKRVFKTLRKNISRNLPLSQWITSSAWKYYTSAITKKSKSKRLNHLIKYAIFGDPSFRIDGIPSYYGVPYHIQENQSTIFDEIDSSYLIKSIQIFSIDGRLIGEYSNIENFSKAAIPIGIYIVSIDYINGKQVSQKCIINN